MGARVHIAWQLRTGQQECVIGFELIFVNTELYVHVVVANRFPLRMEDLGWYHTPNYMLDNAGFEFELERFVN